MNPQCPQVGFGFDKCNWSGMSPCFTGWGESGCLLAFLTHVIYPCLSVSFVRWKNSNMENIPLLKKFWTCEKRTEDRWCREERWYWTTAMKNENKKTGGRETMEELKQRHSGGTPRRKRWLMENTTGKKPGRGSEKKHQREKAWEHWVAMTLGSKWRQSEPFKHHSATEGAGPQGKASSAPGAGQWEVWREKTEETTHWKEKNNSAGGGRH